MFYVIKIHDIFVPLVCGKIIHEMYGQTHQFPNKGLYLLHLSDDLLQRECAIITLCFFHAFFDGIPSILYSIEEDFIAVIAARLAPDRTIF